MKIQSSTWYKDLKNIEAPTDLHLGRKPDRLVSFNIGLSYFKETFFFLLKQKALNSW